MDDPKPTPLYTPAFAAKKRRSTFWAMIMCLLMGSYLLASALFARLHGGMVSGGFRHGPLEWWLAAPAGLGLMALGLWGLWGHFTRRD